MRFSAPPQSLSIVNRKASCCMVSCSIFNILKKKKEIKQPGK